jgi:DNA repair exonuclease SbcCD ATPase subunit
MVRPLPPSDHPRSGTNGHPQDRTATSGAAPAHPAAPHDHARASLGQDELIELEHLRAENAQLRTLCLELEQALQEASQHQAAASDERIKEYEALLDEKTDMIRALHEQAQQTKAALEEAEAKLAEVEQAPPAVPPAAPRAAGPAPREEELLALSEELERERRQLQEDERTLMDQMREMEISMAKERAELARQRNDLQRLQGEIRHELERLERNGPLQSRIDNLRTRLQDVTTRRGAAPASFKK